MCLGVPAEVLSVEDRSFMRTGWVDFGGVRREICLDLVPEARPGDYVIVHTGFAISWLDKERAEEALSVMAEMALADAAPPVSAAAHMAVDAGQTEGGA